MTEWKEQYVIMVFCIFASVLFPAKREQDVYFFHELQKKKKNLQMCISDRNEKLEEYVNLQKQRKIKHMVKMLFQLLSL